MLDLNRLMHVFDPVHNLFTSDTMTFNFHTNDQEMNIILKLINGILTTKTLRLG